MTSGCQICHNVVILRDKNLNILTLNLNNIIQNSLYKATILMGNNKDRSKSFKKKYPWEYDCKSATQNAESGVSVSTLQL